MKKGLAYAIIGLGLGVGGYATYLIFKNLNNARIDSRTVSVEEALAELQKSR
jgi:hypothetical protein